jgi:short-subunit dehydrogenase
MKLERGMTALISGANGGIGASIARALHGAGLTVILSGRRADAMAPLAQELGARVLVGDLARAEDVRRLCDEAGAVDLFVANAAVSCSGDFLGFSEDELQRALEVNVRAPMEMTRRLVPGMVERGRGHAVFISSVAGKVASPGTAVYSATKFALRGFSLALRGDLRTRNVGVSCVYPGFIRDAGMFARTGVALPRGIGTRSPDDVADAVLTAVRENRAEVVVAALEQRLGMWLGDLAPSWVPRVFDAAGSQALSEQIIERQRTWRT